MHSRFLICPQLAKRMRYRCTTIPFVRSFSSKQCIITKKKWSPLSKGVCTVLVTTGLAGSVYYFLAKTYRFELMEYAREHKNTILKDGSWRDAMAVGLVDMYRKSGTDVISLMHCGRFLGKYVSDDEQYSFLSFFQ